jgi:hypothetical protein
LHAVVPVGAGSGWHVPEHRPVQHSPAVAQGVAVALQVVLAHRPATQDWEQHSPASAQAAPGVLQNAVVVQVPLHAAEQHWAPEVQSSPLARQVETGTAHCWVTGLQYPPQHVASLVQLYPFALQVGAVPQSRVVASQYREQQSELRPQLFPLALHGSAQVLDASQEPEQQSPGPAQLAPFAAQVAGAWQDAGLPEQRPVQHSPPPPQSVPFGLQGVAQVPASQNPEQHAPGAPGHATPSPVQATATHTWVFGSHAPEVQSAGAAQERPSWHFVAHDPPQSTSVSLPFRNPSAHVGAAHSLVPGLQKSVAQSAATAQPCPLAQVCGTASARHAAPPQSTPVSLPFLKPSAQVGAAHRWVEGLQNPEVQSAATPQPAPFAHRLAGTRARQAAPPQSTPVSAPFFTPSEHVGAVAVAPLDPALQPARVSASATANASDVIVGRAGRDMGGLGERGARSPGRRFP